MLTRRSSLCLLAVLSGCAVSHGSEPGELLGSALFTVDRGAPEGAQVSVAFIPAPDAGLAGPKALERSVLSDVTLVGPGVWDDATQRLSATVRITNGAAPAMDEPYMVVTQVSQPASCVIFEGQHSGSSYVGATYAFADITPPGPSAVNGASAKQGMAIYNPCRSNFTFRVDVRAVVRGSRRVVPDRDDDGFNVEAGEPAGDDCNDFDASVFPGGPVPCACSLSCAGCALGCCDEACENGCSRTCTAGCVCDVRPGPGSRGSLRCQPGSTCNLDCASGAECDLSCSNAMCTSYCEGSTGGRDACRTTCQNGASCAQQCVDAEDDCEYDDCSGGSQCTLDCANTAGECRFRNECQGGATCELTCDETQRSCDIDACIGRSVCQVECNGRTGGSCAIDRCDGGSTCDVDCTGNVRGTCGIGVCEDGATCNVTCGDTRGGRCAMSCDGSSSCTLDCGDYTGRDCHLDCQGGRARRCSGTNVWVCPGTSCPA
jgi:hypothetical protein